MARGLYYYNKQDNITAQEIYVQIESLLGGEESVQHADVYYNLSIIKQRLYQDQNISRLYSTKAYKLYKN